MNKNKLSLFPGVLFVLAVVTCAGLRARGAETMELDQNQIHQNETAQLTVQTSGADGETAGPPVVPGLEFTAENQSSQIQIINGAMTATSSVTYAVTPQAPGTYTIPAPDGAGKNLVLQVLPGAGPASPAAASSSSAMLPPPPGADADETAPTSATQGAPFVRMELPKRPLYVGETVPVEIQMGLPADSQPTLDGLPSLTADAFTLDKLSEKPEQTQQEVNGQPYIIVTWHSALAAIKPGNFSLGLTAPVTIQQRQANNPAAQGDDDDDSMFGASIFRNFFATTVQKNLTLTDTSQTIHVLPLPAAGQPAGFSGAVGQFEISSSIAPLTAAAGDPLTLRLAVKGAGSFDRVDTSMLSASPGWKTYPPTVKFVPSDSAGYQGEKDFEQAIIPLQGGRQIPPPLSFSYFNPESRHYVTLRTDPPAVDITGSATPLAQSPAVNAPVVAASAPTTDGLRADEPITGPALRTLRPLYFQPGFLAGQGALALGFLGSGFWLRRRDRLASDTRLIQKNRELGAAHGFLGEMDAAAGRHDAPAFFLSARQALQHSLGWRWNIAPAAVTTAEVERHLNGKGENVRRVFDLADQMAYAHDESIEADFGVWRKTVHQLVKQAETL
jgi:hypothetical protein